MTPLQPSEHAGSSHALAEPRPQPADLLLKCVVCTRCLHKESRWHGCIQQQYDISLEIPAASLNAHADPLATPSRPGKCRPRLFTAVLAAALPLAMCAMASVPSLLTKQCSFTPSSHVPQVV